MGLRRRLTQEQSTDQEDFGWQTRTITLVADRAATLRCCADWEREHWQVLTIDQAPPTVSGHPCHVVRVAVPPRGWRSLDELVTDSAL